MSNFVTPQIPSSCWALSGLHSRTRHSALFDLLRLLMRLDLSMVTNYLKFQSLWSMSRLLVFVAGLAISVTTNAYSLIGYNSLCFRFLSWNSAQYSSKNWWQFQCCKSGSRRVQELPVMFIHQYEQRLNRTGPLGKYAISWKNVCLVVEL